MVFIDSPQDLSESERQTLWDRLRQFNQQQGMPFLTYRLQHRFELTTNTLMLKELTQQYPTYSLTAFPAEKLTFPSALVGAVLAMTEQAQGAETVPFNGNHFHLHYFRSPHPARGSVRR